jgi:Domain of unknown function (DUF5099)
MTAINLVLKATEKRMHALLSRMLGLLAWCFSGMAYKQSLCLGGKLKKPLYVLIVDEYGEHSGKDIAGLKRKYGLGKLLVYGKDVKNASLSKFREFVMKYIKEVHEKDPSSRAGKASLEVDGRELVRRAMEENSNLFPSLVVLCSDVFKLELSPELIYFPEIYHVRKGFSEEVLLDGLVHYGECNIKNGN